MRIRISKLKVGDETVKGFIIDSIEQQTPDMLKITYNKIIPDTMRNWEFVHVNGYSYIKDTADGN